MIRKRECTDLIFYWEKPWANPRMSKELNPLAVLPEHSFQEGIIEQKGGLPSELQKEVEVTQTRLELSGVCLLISTSWEVHCFV